MMRESAEGPTMETLICAFGRVGTAKILSSGENFYCVVRTAATLNPTVPSATKSKKRHSRLTLHGLPKSEIL